MRKGERPAQIGVQPGRIAWVAWDRRRVMVREVVTWWDEPAAPWAETGGRHYARLLLVTGAVVEVYQEGERWMVCGVED